MKDNTIKKIVRASCPKTKVLRRALSSRKIKQYKRYCLDAGDIAMGERGKEGLLRAVAICEKRWQSEYRRIANVAKKHFDRAGVSLSEPILLDILFCYFAYGFMPDEYLCFGFDARSYEQRREFTSDRDRKIIVYSVNDIIEIERFLDKWKTFQAFAPFYGREAVSVSKHSSFESFYSFFQSHNRFVCKDVRLSKGDSVQLIERSSISNPKAFFENIASRGDAIVEELIEQSKSLSKINPTSVNTVRVITLAVGCSIEVVDCFLKVGRNGSFVDNGGAGGLLIGIDKESGMLVTDGRDEFSNVFERHPDTGLCFKGYQLPEWENLLTLAKKISAKEESIPYIGWDFAHTERGWVVVEGNASGQLIGPQIVTQTGSRKRILELLQDVNQIIPIDL